MGCWGVGGEEKRVGKRWEVRKWREREVVNNGRKNAAEWTTRRGTMEMSVEMLWRCSKGNNRGQGIRNKDMAK